MTLLILKWISVWINLFICVCNTLYVYNYVCMFCEPINVLACAHPPTRTMSHTCTHMHTCIWPTKRFLGVPPYRQVIWWWNYVTNLVIQSLVGFYQFSLVIFIYCYLLMFCDLFEGVFSLCCYHLLLHTIKDILGQLVIDNKKWCGFLSNFFLSYWWI